MTYPIGDDVEPTQRTVKYASQNRMPPLIFKTRIRIFGGKQYQYFPIRLLTLLERRMKASI
jgi:hypothetical protein